MSALLMIPALGKVPGEQTRDSQSRKSSSSGSRPSDSSSLYRSRSVLSSTSKRSLFSRSSKPNGLRSSRSSEFDSKMLKECNQRLDSVFEKKLFEFDYKLDVIYSRVESNVQNVALNSEMRNGQRFFCPQIINTLRYTYFEKLEASDENILASLNRSPKPEYWSKVWDLDAYNHCHLFGASCKKNLLVVDQALVKKSLRDRKTTERAFREGKKVASLDDEPNRETPIRDVWHSSSFWKDVFYDTRTASTTEDLDEWLPPVDVVQRFFITVTDYILYNMHCLDCKVSETDKAGLSESEASSLEQQYFYYFNDADYAFFSMITRVFNDTFLQQIRTFLHTDEEVLRKIREVLKILVETITSNLQINYFGVQGVDEVLEVWHDFLLMALEKLVIANLKPVMALKHTIQEGLPEMGHESILAEGSEARRAVLSTRTKKKKNGFFARLGK